MSPGPETVAETLWPVIATPFASLRVTPIVACTVAFAVDGKRRSPAVASAAGNAVPAPMKAVESAAEADGRAPNVATAVATVVTAPVVELNVLINKVCVVSTGEVTVIVNTGGATLVVRADPLSNAPESVSIRVTPPAVLRPLVLATVLVRVPVLPVADAPVALTMLPLSTVTKYEVVAVTNDGRNCHAAWPPVCAPTTLASEILVPTVARTTDWLPTATFSVAAVRVDDVERVPAIVDSIGVRVTV
jgi:hypothetical protein